MRTIRETVLSQILSIFAASISQYTFIFNKTTNYLFYSDLLEFKNIYYTCINPFKIAFCSFKKLS